MNELHTKKRYVNLKHIVLRCLVSLLILCTLSFVFCVPVEACTAFCVKIDKNVLWERLGLYNKQFKPSHNFSGRNREQFMVAAYSSIKSNKKNFTLNDAEEALKTSLHYPLIKEKWMKKESI